MRARIVDARAASGELADLRVGLIGAHQAQNAAVSLALLDAIGDRHGVRVSEGDVRRGLAEVRWPGRLELLDGSRVGLPRVLLDGAHTPAGARALVAELGDHARISIDTSKGAVAIAAVEAGATIVNDVWAARRDPGTADAAAASGSHLVLMHNQDGTGYPDGVFPAVVTWLAKAVEAAVARGVSRDRLILDPGIGFGKTTADNLELLHRLGELKATLGGLPLLIGTSRKRFLGELLGGAAPDDRVEGSAATVALAVMSGADIVRVHDVPPIARTLRVADAVVRR